MEGDERVIIQEEVSLIKKDKLVAISALWWFSSGLGAGILIGLLIAKLVFDFQFSI